MPLPGAIAGVEPEAACGFNGPIMDSNGNMYKVMEELLADGNHPRMMKSSDGGVTWSGVDTANQPTGAGSYNDMESAWIAHRPTAKEIVLTYMKAQSRWWGMSFRTSDHPTNPDTWDTSTFATTSGQDQFATIASESGISSAVLSDGTVRAFIRGEPQAGNQAFLHRTKATTTWDTGSTYITHASVDMTRPSCVVGESDTTWLFYKDHTNGRIYCRSISSTGTVGSPIRVDTGGAGLGASYENNVVAPVYYDDAGAEVLVVGFVNASNQLRTVEVRNGTPAAEQQVHADAVIVNPGTTDNQGPSAALAVHGTTVYAVWGDATTGDLYYAERPNGGSWSARTLLTAATTIGWVYANVMTRPDDSTVLGYTYDSAATSEVEATYYNELALASLADESELNEAFPITATLGKTTDHALPMTVQMGATGDYPVAQALESDIAQPVAATITRRYVPVGLTTEADAAQLTGRAKSKAVGQDVETDTAQALTSQQPNSTPVLQASEADTAQTVVPTITHRYIAVGLAVGVDSTAFVVQGLRVAEEVDVAQPITFTRSQTVGLVSETDAAQPLLAVRAISLGLAEEADSGHPFSSAKVRTNGGVLEADTAQPMAAIKSYVLGSALENDSAHTITTAGNKNIGVLTASEADSAQPMSGSKAILLGQAVEVDASQPLTSAVTHKRTVGLAQETDSAQPLSSSGNKNIAVGQATESDVVFGLASRKVKATGQATEADTAGSIIVRRGYPIGLAQTTGTANGLSSQKRKATGLATESDSPLPLSFAGQKNIAVGLVVESDTAQGLTRRRAYTVEVVTEVDSATGVQIHKARLVAVVVEGQAANPMSMKVGFVPATHPQAYFAPSMRSGSTVVSKRTAAIVSGKSQTTWRNDQ